MLCEDCKYFVAEKPEQRYSKGQCRRYPPAPFGDSLFPTVSPHAWCGEWEPREVRK